MGGWLDLFSITLNKLRNLLKYAIVNVNLLEDNKVCCTVNSVSHDASGYTSKCLHYIHTHIHIPKYEVTMKEFGKK